LIPATAPKPIRRWLLLAMHAPERMLERQQRYQVADDHEFAWRQYCLGLANLRLQRLAALQLALSQARQAFGLSHDPLGLLYCEGLALAGAWLAGTNVENLQRLEGLAHRFRALGYPLEATRTDLLRVLHYYSLGQVERGLSLIQPLEASIDQLGSRYDQAYWLWISGMTYSHNHDFNQAGRLLDQAFVLFSSLHMQPECARCLFDRSWLWQRQERYAAAFNDLAAAQTLADDLNLVYLIAACAKNTGLALSRLGRYAAALDWTLDARRRYGQLARHDFINGCELNLANILYYAGLYELALKMFERLEGNYRRLNLLRMAAGSVRNQALVLRAQHQAQAAYDLLRSIEAPILQGTNQLEQAEYWQALAFALAEQGDIEQATTIFGHAESLFKQLDNQPAAAKCRLELAWLALKQHQSTDDSDNAQIHTIKHQLQQTLGYLDDRPFYRWRILYGLGLCEAAFGKTAAALDYYTQVSLIITNLRLEFFDEHASSAIFVQAHDLFTAALDLTLQANNPLALLQLSEQQRALVLRQHLDSGRSNRRIPRALQAQLWRGLRTDSLGFLDDLPPVGKLEIPEIQFDITEAFDQLDIAQLRQHLTAVYQARWVVLAYICHGSRLIRLTLTPTMLQADVIVLDAGLKRLIERASLARYRWFTYSGQQASDQPIWPELESLASHLLPPIVSQPLDYLLIVPAEPLHGIAWGTLRLNQKWLAQHTAINILPNLSHIQPTAMVVKPYSQGVMIGCSEFRDDLPALPNVEPEIAQLEAIYADQPTLTLQNAAVTKARIFELSNAGSLLGCRFLHIASHAQLRSGAGQAAYIQLWDERLSFDQIIDLQLQGTWVILSVCDGSASDVLAGEEVLSLSRAFLAAGATAVIANLWKQADDASPRLMARLHSLLHAGSDPVRALCLLQNDWLMHYDNASPLVWGGLQVISSLA